MTVLICKRIFMLVVYKFIYQIKLSSLINTEKWKSKIKVTLLWRHEAANQRIGAGLIDRKIKILIENRFYAV